MIWHYMNKEGRPKQKGVYLVTLIFNGWDKEKQEPNNEKFAMIDTRYLCDAKAEDLTDWVMGDEPEEGLVWTEETGSMVNERVWAWAEIEFNDFEETPFPDILPAGVEKWEDQDE